MINVLDDFDNGGQAGIHISDKNFKEKRSRLYSPDGSKMILFYGIDEGAWDGGYDLNAAILKKSELNESISQFAISSLEWDDIYWLNNDTVILCENYAEFMRSGKSSYENPVFTVNSVAVKVVRKDPIDSSYSMRILYKETSPDNKWELIAYRYVREDNAYYPLHISIVPKEGSVPKYGNFFISKYGFDCIQSVKRTKQNTILLNVSSACYSAFDYYLVVDRPYIEYTLKICEEDEKMDFGRH